MLKIFFAMAFFLSSWASFAAPWSKEEKEYYLRRNFIVLEHLLVEKHEVGRADLIARQERDLSGCRALHHGSGGIASTIQCMTFLSREKRMGIKSQSSIQMVKDINVICQKLIEQPGVLEKFLISKVLKTNSGQWRPCLHSAWRQVYLTAYASFDADPVGTLAIVRRAEATFQPDKTWESKINTLIKQN